MKLSQIPQDKANHFIYGFVIYFIANLFLSAYLSFAIVCVFAIGKEVYDKYYRTGFNLWDLLFALIPAVILTLKEILWKPSKKPTRARHPLSKRYNKINS